MHILDSLETNDAWVTAFSNAQTYIKDVKAKVSVWGLGENKTLSIQLIDNAMKSGKVCHKFSFCNQARSQSDTDAVKMLLSTVKFSLSKLIDIVSTGEYQQDRHDLYTHLGDMRIYRYENRSIRVFSPFNLDALKPLKVLPKKWMVSHAIKLIVNKQYDEFICTSKTTDGYADDAENNYRKGAIKNPLEFASKLIESPDGWRVRQDEEGFLRINCYSFDNNRMKINMNKCSQIDADAA